MSRRPRKLRARSYREARPQTACASSTRLVLTLAERIVTAPRLIEPKAARARVAEWLAGLQPAEAKPLKALLAAHPTVSTLLESLAESSPYLWELASPEPARLLRLLQLRSRQPSRRACWPRHAARSPRPADEAEAMRLLRRMKAEAALLIALADIGGVWPVMRATRALTDLADAAVACGRAFRARRGRARRTALAPKDKARPQDGSGYIVLAMGKMGAFELNYSSDIDLIVFFDPAAPAVPKDVERRPRCSCASRSGW